MVALSGCHRDRKTDEQILRERIDATPVHLYVATKIAVSKADTSPEMAEARRELLAAVEGVRRGGAPPAPDAHELGTLAVALWKLRGEAQAVVSSGHEDGLSPVLPVLLQGASAPPETLAMLDVPTEHALFLAAMLAIRASSQEKSRVPEELILYEAWMTRPGATRLTGFTPVIEALAGMAFSTNRLCDLGAAASARADAAAGDAGATAAATVNALSGGKTSLTADQMTAIELGVRGIAHGLTGSCYLDRDRKAEARVEIERLVSDAEALGASRQEIEGDLARLADHEPGEIQAYLSHVSFGLIKERIERTGALDALADLEIARALRGYVHAAAGAFEGAKRKLHL